MKTLYESLLDDFEELEDRQDKSIRAEILHNSWFRLGADSKTIIFDPESTDAPIFRDMAASVIWSTHSNNRNINDINVCKKLGLRFQPLESIIDQRVGQDKDWLKYFDCEYVVNFSIATERGTTPDIDLSIIKFPIKGSITITGFADMVKSIKTYPHPVEIVRILREPMTPSTISGWKCKHLMIGKVNNVVLHKVESQSDPNRFDPSYRESVLIEWVDEILKNNPDAENIYLGQVDGFTDNRRVVTKGKGVNRKCVKLVRVPTSKWNDILYNANNSELRRMTNEVEGWRWQHGDLFECEGAVTPGNTLGMGNPMVPTDNHNGTEPVIPTHPRNKKKRKHLKESLLDDFDTLASNIDPKQGIKDFISKNYILHKDIDKLIKISDKPNKDGLYEVEILDALGASDWNHQIEYLTNGLFIFTKSKFGFQLFDCSKLKSIEGCPKEIGTDFTLYKCPLLTDWKDIEKDFPKKIGRNFISSLIDPQYANKICKIKGYIKTV